MSNELKINIKDLNHFISVSNFLSRYFYELKYGNKIPLNEETLQEFNKDEQAIIKNYTATFEGSHYLYSEILKNINSEILEYYSNTSNLDLEKSKIILNGWRNNSFQRYIDEAESVKANIDNRIESENVFINIDNKSYLDKFQALVENIHPYSAFNENEIKLIDPEFYKKNSILNQINVGLDCFKKSRLKDGLNCYDNAIRILSEEKVLENLHLYFYSWILHLIGNIHYVIGDFNKASLFFKNSFNIKANIEDLPKPFIFSTQLKLFGLLSYNPVENKKWEENLKKFISKVETYHKTNKDENESLQNHFICDANYYLYNGYTNLRNSKKLKEYFEIAVKSAVNTSDFPGIIKLYVLHILQFNSEVHLRELKQILGKLEPSKKMNPYITTVLKLSEKSTSNKFGLDKLKKIFIESEVPIIE